MHNHIIISDLDGTLLDAEKKISARSAAWIRKWMSSGGLFYIATGRHYYNVKEIFSSAGISPGLVTSNGIMEEDQLIFTPDKALIHHNKHFIELANLYNIHISFFTNEGWFISEVNDMVRSHDFTARRVCQQEMVKLQAFKILLNSDENRLKNLKEVIDTQFPDYDCMFSEERLLEVQRKGINKFSAIQIILRNKQLSNRKIIAFGDGMNDYELLKGSDCGVLMENASASLKAKLPENPVTRSNNHEGVIAFLENYFPATCIWR